MLKKIVKKTKEKKKIIITGLLIASGLVCADYSYHHYTLKNCEVEIDSYGAYFIDSRGFDWSIPLEDLPPEIVDGSIVNLKMYDNRTKTNLTDDKICKIDLVFY